MTKRILIVDDNPDIRRTLRKSIESQTIFQVCGEASNGLEAVEKARELDPHLVILDLSMPIMHGLEAAKILKRMMENVLLILFTSHAENFVEADARAAGITAVISKQDGLTNLLGKVRVLLG